MSPTRYHYATLLQLNQQPPPPFSINPRTNSTISAENTNCLVKSGRKIGRSSCYTISKPNESYLNQSSSRKHSSHFLQQSFISSLFTFPSRLIHTPEIVFYLIIIKIYSNFQKMSEFASLHSRNLSIQAIVQQNQELRRYLQHSKQNEQVIIELASKLELQKNREAELISLNTSLHEKVRTLQRASQEKENAYSEEMQYVFAQHDKITVAKEQEIKCYKNQLEKITEKWRCAQEIARVHQEKERQIAQRYEGELARYKDSIVEFERELDKVYRSAESQKHSFDKAKSTWALERQAQSGQIMKLVDALKKLQSDNLLLMDYTKELQSNLFKTQQQNRNSLVSLRAKLIEQEEQIKQYIYINQQLESDTKIIAKQLEELKRLQAHLSTDNQALTSENDKIINLLTESDKECKYLRSQITQLEVGLSKSVEKKELELQELKCNNLELLRSKTQVESFVNSKIAELREVSSTANHFQTLVNKQEACINNLSTDLNELEGLLTRQKKKSSDQSLQLKELTDRLTISEQQNSRLQEITKRLQLQVQEMSSETASLAKYAALPKDINKQFIEQMNKMLVKFREERDEQSKFHILQKEKLKERYEYQAKQMELDLLKKIAVLEEQLSISRKFQILAERNSNIYTYTSKF